MIITRTKNNNNNNKQQQHSSVHDDDDDDDATGLTRANYRCRAITLYVFSSSGQWLQLTMTIIQQNKNE
jgi:hypothetical protein